MKKILLVLFILSGCGNDDFNKVEQLDSFRILGIVASAPEVAATGGSVSVDLVVSDVKGGGRTVSGEYETCVDPGVSLGAPPSCDFDPTSAPTSFSINTGSLSGTLFTGVVAGPTISVPANILTGRSARDQFNGVGYIVLFRFDVDGQRVEAFKRIMVTNRGALNTNPVVNSASMTLNGGSISSRPQKNDKLQITNPATETYDFITVDGKIGTRTENYQVAWYVTSGKLNKAKVYITEDVEYDDEVAASSLVVLALVRDERGGLAISQNFIP